MAQKNLAKLLALPYVHMREGALYVRVYYRASDGKYRSKEKRLPADAKPEDAVTLVGELKAKLDVPPAQLDGERMTFQQLLDQYETAHTLAPWYREPLETLNERKIRSLTYADCKRFKEAREAVKRVIPNPDNSKEKIAVARKPATINRELEALRSVLLYAVRHGWLLRSPFTAGPPLIRKSEEDIRQRIPTPEEEARLLAVCVPPRAHLRGLIIATRDTGLRRSALFALDWAMVDWTAGLLKVPKGNQYKRRPNLIGLTARLLAELRALWYARGCPESGAIFDQVKDFKRSYRTACRLAKITGLRFNDLRHGFSTDLMEADISKELAMKVSGHSNLDTHEIYRNVDPRLALRVAEALNKLHAERQIESLTTPEIQ